MKKSLLFLAFAFSANFLFGQALTGIKTIPGDYASLATAITGLNANGVGSGGVIFNIASGYSETFTTPASGLITATGTALNPIVFQKSGSGENPLITAATGVGTTDGIIILAGSDFIRFDGITLMENSANNTNTKRMEWGFALVKKQNTAPFDGCQHVVIKNCTITLNKANNSSRGIYAGNHLPSSVTPLAITETTDATSHCEFYGNTINNCFQPLSLNGYNAPSPYTLHDQNNLIGIPQGNTISGFTGSGIYAIYQNNIRINNNVITESTGSLGTLYGIQADAALQAKGEITGNTISLRSGITNATTIYGISCKLGNNSAGSEVKISGNIIQDCSFNTTISTAFYGIDAPSAAQSLEITNNQVVRNTIPGSGSFYGINVPTNPSLLTISGNKISDNKKTGPQGSSYGIFTGASTEINAVSNIISNNTILNSSGTIQCEIYGYYNASTCINHTISKNSIDSLIIGGTNTHMSNRVTGIYSDGSSDTKIISENTLQTLSTHAGYATGIYSRYGDRVRIYRNSLSSISSDAGTNSSSLNALTCIRGIDVNYAFRGLIHNNFVYDLKTLSANNVHSISGIFIGSDGNYGRTANLYHNTVFLNASSTGSDFGSSAVYCATTSNSLTFLMQSNILVNTSTNSGLGKTSAFRRYDLPATNYSKLSDKNCFYAGTPGPNNVIYQAGAFSYKTIEDYKGIMSSSGKDANSFSELPPFINTTSVPCDLHIQAGALTKCESGGIVAVYADETIDFDFDGDPRYPSAGYPVDPSFAANAPDVGADEFAGINLDDVGPVIEYESLKNTGSLQPRTLIATITDENSGIPVSGIGLPVLYWRISGSAPGSWNVSQATSNGNDQFSFSFGGGVQYNDTVYYYIVAQDLAPIPNVSSIYNTTGLSSNPPACSTPFTWSEYLVAQLCGNYTVGKGKNYETIQAAMNDLVIKEITCPVTLLLTDESYIESINIMTPNGASETNTVTIRPAPRINAMIHIYSTSGVLNFYDADYFIFDGSNEPGGSSKNLIIENSEENSSLVIITSFGYDNTGSQHNIIRNCILRGGSQIYSSFGIKTNDGPHKDWLLENNEFQNLSTAISLKGTSNKKIEQVKISRNIFGNPVDSLTLSLAGIEVSYTDQLTVSDNKFLNMINPEDNPVAISLGVESTNAVISKNIITGVKYTGNENFGGKGIEINTNNISSNIAIYNNAISGISGDGYDDLPGDAIVGIRIDGTTGGVKLYHNSVNLSGTISGNYQNNKSAAVYLGSPVSDISLLNNIFANSLEDNLENSVAYAIYSDAAPTAFSSIDFNNYFTSGPEGVLGFSGTNRIDLADWKSATGKDLHSMSFLPPFMSNTNLRLSVSNNAGTPIPEVTTDADGVVRNHVNPDIGAYESSLTSSGKNGPADIANITIYSSNDIIYINPNGNPARVSVYNALGQPLHHANLISNALHEIKVETPGVYIVRIISGQQVNSTRVFCK